MAMDTEQRILSDILNTSQGTLWTIIAAMAGGSATAIKILWSELKQTREKLSQSQLNRLNDFREISRSTNEALQPIKDMMIEREERYKEYRDLLYDVRDELRNL